MSWRGNPTEHRHRQDEKRGFHVETLHADCSDSRAIDERVLAKLFFNVAATGVDRNARADRDRRGIRGPREGSQEEENAESDCTPECASKHQNLRVDVRRTVVW
jgi:hypothetical protein